MPLDLKARSRIPQPWRGWLFKVYPGTWTREEVAFITQRNLALLEDMLALHQTRIG